MVPLGWFLVTGFAHTEPFPWFWCSVVNITLHSHHSHPGPPSPGILPIWPWKCFKAGVGDNPALPQLWCFYCLQSKGSRGRVLWGAKLPQAGGRETTSALWELLCSKLHREAVVGGSHGYVPRGADTEGCWIAAAKKKFRKQKFSSSRENVMRANTKILMLQWKFASIADNLFSLFEYESLQFPNKQEVSSAPPIPCTAPLGHKSASLQLAAGTPPLAAASRYLKSWGALYQQPWAQLSISSCLPMLSLI